MDGIKKPRGGASLIYHAKKRYGADVQLHDLTAEQLAELESDRAEWIAELGRASVRARRLHAAARLREQAEEMERLALAGVS